MSTSVTVSIAEDRIGMLSGISRVSWVLVSAWLGRTLEFERLQEHVIEGQAQRNVGDVFQVGHIGPWQETSDLPRGG